MRSRLVGVVPAAGHGLRLGLVEGSKELVDVGRRPVIEYLLERLEAAGCDEIRLVTRPEKVDLVEFARRRDLTVVLGQPAHVGASIGLGIAGLGADDVVAVGFPDTIWQPPDGFARLGERLSPSTDVVLGLFRTPDAHRSDVVLVDEDGGVLDIIVKPAEPPCDLIYRCFVARAHALSGIEQTGAPSDHLRLLGRRVVGAHLSASWIDVGTPQGLALARASATKTSG